MIEKDKMIEGDDRYREGGRERKKEGFFVYAESCSVNHLESWPYLTEV